MKVSLSIWLGIAALLGCSALLATVKTVNLEQPRMKFTDVTMREALPSLNDWIITVDRVSIDEECLVIIDYPNLATIQIDNSPQCAVHEMIHVAVRAACMSQGNNGTEEQVVKDITRLILR